MLHYPLPKLVKPLPRNISLSIRAAELFPESQDLQLKWIKAVHYLRNQSKKGWAIDKMILKSPEERIL